MLTENLLDNNSQELDPATSGDTSLENKEQDQVKPGANESNPIKQIRDQLKLANKQIQAFQAKEKSEAEAESLKKGEFEKLLTEKDESIKNTSSELETLKRKIAISEVLESQKANPKYKELILKSLDGVANDELDEKVDLLKKDYPEFFTADKIKIPSSDSNFSNNSPDKVITKAMYNDMLDRGENAIDLIRQGYKLDLS